MVLVDTSAWIEVFRKGTRLTLMDVAPIDEVLTCVPVIEEVLSGFGRSTRTGQRGNPCSRFPSWTRR